MHFAVIKNLRSSVKRTIDVNLEFIKQPDKAVAWDQ